MAYDMVFSGASDQEGEVERFFLCSIGAWEQVAKWAKSIDGMPALNALILDGEHAGTDELARELEQAEPPDAGVRATLAALADKVGVGDAGETVAITDAADEA